MRSVGGVLSRHRQSLAPALRLLGKCIRSFPAQELFHLTKPSEIFFPFFFFPLQYGSVPSDPLLTDEFRVDYCGSSMTYGAINLSMVSIFRSTDPRTTGTCEAILAVKS
jgi:hypothetical protein